MSQLQQREAEYKGQLDGLKAAAQQAYVAAETEAQQAAASAGRLPQDSNGDGGDLAGLRARLEGAVEAMQAGLVERDTEVGAGGAGGIVCSSLGMAQRVRQRCARSRDAVRRSIAACICPAERSMCAVPPHSAIPYCCPLPPPWSRSACCCWPR